MASLRARTPQPDLDEDAMKATFDSWDKDGDGLISANDLREVVSSFGEEWSDENVNDMIYYKKNNGVFSFEVRLLYAGRGGLGRPALLHSHARTTQDLREVLFGGKQAVRANGADKAPVGSASGAR